MKRGREKNIALNQAIGARVYQERQRRGLSLKVVAERGGLHLNTVDNAEKGRAITLATLCRIAIGLGVKLDALVPLSQCIVGCDKKSELLPRNAANVNSGTTSQL